MSRMRGQIRMISAWPGVQHPSRSGWWPLTAVRVMRCILGEPSKFKVSCCDFLIAWHIHSGSHPRGCLGRSVWDYLPSESVSPTVYKKIEKLLPKIAFDRPQCPGTSHRSPIIVKLLANKKRLSSKHASTVQENQEILFINEHLLIFHE